MSGLTKSFGSVRAIDDLSFTVEPGSVTGFLGPNGAGKTTTLRILLGLVTADSGSATIADRPYAALQRPADEVGAVLDAAGFVPARSGRDHLRVYCTVNGYPPTRIAEVLAQVGLADAGDRAVRGYSLGMRQRLALATALLGDPRVLVLDEPANGLDPEGIAWIRRLLREFADQERTVLVSSHVLSEMRQLVDHAIIINKGRRVWQGTLAELTAEHGHVVSVRTPTPADLELALARLNGGGPRIQRIGADALRVTGMRASDVGHVAWAEQIELHELTTEDTDLERAFFALTAENEEVA